MIRPLGTAFIPCSVRALVKVNRRCYIHLEKFHVSITAPAQAYTCVVSLGSRFVLLTPISNLLMEVSFESLELAIAHHPSVRDLTLI